MVSKTKIKWLEYYYLQKVDVNKIKRLSGLIILKTYKITPKMGYVIRRLSGLIILSIKK